MSLTIDHYPNRRFRLFPCTAEFRVNINEAVKGHLKPAEKLTNETALKILKQIQWKSNLYAFFSKGIVLVVIGAATIGMATSIPPVGIALLARVLIAGVGGGIIGFAAENSLCKNFLPELSQAYRDQSARAAEYIKTIEKQGSEMEFIFPPEPLRLQLLPL